MHWKFFLSDIYRDSTSPNQKKKKESFGHIVKQKALMLTARPLTLPNAHAKGKADRNLLDRRFVFPDVLLFGFGTARESHFDGHKPYFHVKKNKNQLPSSFFPHLI